MTTKRWAVLALAGGSVVLALAFGAYAYLRANDRSKPLDERTAVELIRELKESREGLALAHAYDSAAAVRVSLCKVLASHVKDADLVVPELLAVARTDPVLIVRLSALEALGTMGSAASNAVPVLLRLLRETPDRATRMALTDAIPKVADPDPPVIAVVTGMLRSRDPGLAASAATLVSHFGKDPAVGEELVLEALSAQTNFFSRLGLLGALGERPSPSAQALEVLQSALFETNWLTRRAAVNALGKLGPSAAGTSSNLLAMLASTRPTKVSPRMIRGEGRQADHEAELHCVVLKALSRMGQTAPGALAALTEESQDAENVFRFHAAVARLQVDGDCRAAREVFTAGANDDDSDVRLLALTKLAEVGPLCPDTIDLVVAALQRTDRASRFQGIQLLPHYGTNAWTAEKVLAQLSEDPHRALSYAARTALTNLQTRMRETTHGQAP